MRLKNNNKGQAYLIIIFELVIAASFFFFLVFPLAEQVKGMIGLLDSYKALDNAESGLEIALFSSLQNQTILGLESYPAPTISGTKVIITGKGKFSERNLIYAQQ